MALVDFISVPYISAKADVQNLREALGPTGKGIGILAKIDTIDGFNATAYGFRRVLD